MDRWTYPASFVDFEKTSKAKRSDAQEGKGPRAGDSEYVRPLRETPHGSADPRAVGFAFA